MNDVIPKARVEGTVSIGGRDIYGADVDVVELRRRVGMVFQKSNPFPKSIFDNVAYGLRINGMVKSRAQLADAVEKSLRGAALWDEVKDRLHDSAMALSGGQQQRLCIARALAIEPEVVLMDEPASALDPIATQRIEELIYQLKRDYTIVIVTHNMQQAARVSDTTAFFWLGRLIEVGPTASVFTSPREKLTEDYVTGASARTGGHPMNHDTRHFAEELAELKQRLLVMGGLAEERLQARRARDGRARPRPDGGGHQRRRSDQPAAPRD